MSLEHRTLNIIIESCVISLVIFTPLALGTTQPWSIFIMRITVLVALLAWLLKLFSTIHDSRFTIHKIPFTTHHLGTPLLIPILIFLSVAVISTIISSYKWFSLSLLTNLFVYAAIYFLIVKNLKSKAQIKRLITAIFLTSLILGIYGLLQYSRILVLLPHYLLTRISSTYYNSNHYSGYLVMVTPIPIALFLFLPRSKLTICLIMLSILLTINLALSYSFGAIGFGAGIIFLVTVKIHLSNRKKLAAAIATIVLISFGLLGALSMLSKTPKLPENTFSERYAHMVEFAISHTKGRLYVYKNTIPLILDHPYLGTGPGTFIYTFPKHRPPDMSMFRNYAHNDYLEIASGMGFIGLAAYLFLIISIFARGFAVLKTSSGFNRALIIGALASILSILVHGLFDGNLTVIPANILHFYVIVGLLISTVTNLEHRILKAEH